MIDCRVVEYVATAYDCLNAKEAVHIAILGHKNE
jgi:hypothetical protein